MVDKSEMQLAELVVGKSRSVANAALVTAEVCGPVLSHAIEQLGCCIADVWSVDPRRRNLILVASRYKHERLPSRVDVMPVDGCLTGHVVETKRITSFRLSEPRNDGRCFRNVQLRSVFQVDSMVSVPVLNTANPHQVLCVLNFLPEIPARSSQSTTRRLQVLSAILANAIECSLRELSYRMSMALGQRIAAGEGDFKTIASACEVFATCCLGAIHASRVAVYLRTAAEDTLRPQAIVIRHDENQTAAMPADGLLEESIPMPVETVDRNNREFLVPRVGDENNAAEFCKSLTSDYLNASCIIVPIQDTLGRSRGVVQCFRHPDSSRRTNTRFTYDDIAIIEAMCQSFVPPLETLLASEKRRFALQKLAHELRVPVTAFTVMLKKMRDECRERQFRFTYPHFREGAIYTDLMTRLLKELDIARYGPSNIPLQRIPTNMHTEVIIPALRFTVPLLRTRRFFTWQFTQHNIDKFPKLRIDPALITQVVFNLLDNAIKYYDGPPDKFRCSIDGNITEDHFEISISDNGPGVDEMDVDDLFAYGRRGKNRLANAFGEGIGLWISRAIARRHNGDLFIKKRCDWTTFVLRLPRSLGVPSRG